MKNKTLYGLSLGLTVLLSLAAFIFLLGWMGTVINSAGRLPFLALLPWKPVGLLALAAASCTIRAELIVHNRRMLDQSPSQS